MDADNTRLTKLEVKVDQHKDDINDLERDIKDLREDSITHKNTLAVLEVEVRGIGTKLEAQTKNSKEQYQELKEANKKTNWIIIAASLGVILESIGTRFIA